MVPVTLWFSRKKRPYKDVFHPTYLLRYRHCPLAMSQMPVSLEEKMALSPRKSGAFFFQGAGPEPEMIDMMTGERKLSFAGKLPTESMVFGTPLSDEEMRSEFNKFDIDGNGVLDKEEFLAWYRSKEHYGLDPEQDIDNWTEKYRLDEGETMSYEQFCLCMIHMTAHQ